MKTDLRLLFLLICFSQVWLSEGLTCERHRALFGEISSSISSTSKCWIIEVPEGSYTRINILQLSSSSCSNSYLRIVIEATGENLTYCSQDSKPVNALSDVNVTLTSRNDGWNRYSVSMKINYTTESLICGQKNHFRCSNHSCVHQYQVCDGIKDCENGADEEGCETGVAGVKGVKVSRISAINWIKGQRSRQFGWGRNTHRAITALYLAGDSIYNGENLEEELDAKQLELQISVALQRNASNPISVNELSMFINALTVTCHNARDFYGYDLLQLLSDRASSSKSVIPIAYLTLCNANWTISNSQTSSLIRLLQTLQADSKYPFQLDFQAMTMLALTCIKSKEKGFDKITNATEVYHTSLNKFISCQFNDGSFGNSYTTALVTQALLAGGHENDKKWNLNSTVRYLMKQLNSTSVDLPSTSLILPIFFNKSLVNIGAVDCSNNPRIHGKDDEILDVLKKLEGKMRIQFSLYIGDEKDVIHTLYLRVPENSTVYDVMKIAQVADAKYKFLDKDINNHKYVYEIAGIANDPEAGIFWLLYTADSAHKDKVHHHTKSPDKYILKNDDHMILWYKSPPLIEYKSKGMLMEYYLTVTRNY